MNTMKQLEENKNKRENVRNIKGKKSNKFSRKIPPPFFFSFSLVLESDDVYPKSRSNHLSVSLFTIISFCCCSCKKKNLSTFDSYGQTQARLT